MDGSVGYRYKKKDQWVGKGCPLSMNGLNTFAYLNIIPLGFYDVLIGMDWLDSHHSLLDCYNKTFTCTNEEGKQEMVKAFQVPSQ